MTWLSPRVTSAPGLGSTLDTSTPQLGSLLPHPRRDWAHSSLATCCCTGTWLAPVQICTTPGLPWATSAPHRGSPLQPASSASRASPIPVQICGQGRAQVPVQMWQRFRFFGRLNARACHAVACPAACCVLRVAWLPWTWCLLYGFWRLRRNRIACRMLQIARCLRTYGGTKSAPVSAWMRAHASSRAFKFGAHIVTCHVLPCQPPDQGDCEGGVVGRRACERARASVARVWI
jgi:hypothetical protein